MLSARKTIKSIIKRQPHDKRMAARALTLRLKTKDGQHVINQLTFESTLQELKQKISDLTQIPSRALKILQGFPPKPVNLANDRESLSDLKFQSGDTLIVHEDPNAQKERENQQRDMVMKELESQNLAGGFLCREVVPANNSCLFTSVNFVMEATGKQNLEAASPMREIIAGVVMSDPETFNEAMLGKTNQEYCLWIMNKESWGGAIEVSILSQYYGIEIDVVDTQTVRINRFGEDQNYSQRVLLIYDGIHYDPLMMEPVNPEMPKITKFSTKDESVLQKALELAAEAKSSRQFTDVSKFKLKCLICGKGLVGQAEAQMHAKQTGHINFGEF